MYSPPRMGDPMISAASSRGAKTTRRPVRVVTKVVPAATKNNRRRKGRGKGKGRGKFGMIDSTGFPEVNLSRSIDMKSAAQLRQLEKCITNPFEESPARLGYTGSKTILMTGYLRLNFNTTADGTNILVVSQPTFSTSADVLATGGAFLSGWSNTAANVSNPWVQAGNTYAGSGAVFGFTPPSNWQNLARVVAGGIRILNSGPLTTVAGNFFAGVLPVASVPQASHPNTFSNSEPVELGMVPDGMTAYWVPGDSVDVNEFINNFSSLTTSGVVPSLCVGLLGAVSLQGCLVEAVWHFEVVPTDINVTSNPLNVAGADYSYCTTEQIQRFYMALRDKAPQLILPNARTTRGGAIAGVLTGLRSSKMQGKNYLPSSDSLGIAQEEEQKIDESYGVVDRVRASAVSAVATGAALVGALGMRRPVGIPIIV